MQTPIIGQLLVWGSLTVGALAAATGYLVSLEAEDDALIGLTLAAPAGKIDRTDGDAKPIAEKDQKITAQLLAEIRAAGVRNIRVKEFELRRWRGKWFLLVSVAGLLLGGFLTRAGERPRSVSRSAEDRTDSPHYGPTASVRGPLCLSQDDKLQASAGHVGRADYCLNGRFGKWYSIDLSNG